MGNLFSWFNYPAEVEKADGHDFSLIEENATLHFNRALGIKPKSSVTLIRISLKPDVITLGLEFDEKIEGAKTGKYSLIKYKNIQNGCTVEWLLNQDFKEKHLEGQHFLDVFWKNLEVILRTQKSILDSFEIELSDKLSLDILEKFFNNVKKTLEYRNSLLQVKAFTVNYTHLPPILQILQHIHLETLEKIGIINNAESYKGIDLDKIAMMDQWKQAEELNMHHFDMTIPLEHFRHFSKVKISLKTLSSEDVILLKQEFLSSSSLNYFQIKCQNFVVDPLMAFVRPSTMKHSVHEYKHISAEDHLVEVFGDPATSINHLKQTEKRWFFQKSKSEQLILIKLVSDTILFQRVKLSDFAEFSDYIVVVN